MGVVTFFFKIKTDLNQAMKQACALTQLFFTTLFHIFPPLTFTALILKRRMEVVASFFKIKTDPNQAMKRACVLTQPWKTFA